MRIKPYALKKEITPGPGTYSFQSSINCNGKHISSKI